MASTYVNDLRLEEIGSGEQSTTWGTTTNTNLELIAEAFGYATEAITEDADTFSTTGDVLSNNRIVSRICARRLISLFVL